MKKFTRALALALAVVMASFSLTSCGGDNSGGNEGSAGSGTTIKLGGIGPITGDTAVYGKAVMNGAKLAVDEINAKGGVQYELSFQDDENNAEKAVNAYNSLKDWGMQILIGTVTSTPCIAVAAKSYEDNLFQLTPSGSAVDCVKYDNAFRVCFSDPNQGKASAQYIGENNLAKKVAVIYDSSDVYSSGIYNTFAAEAKNQGIEIVEAQAFTNQSNSDFTTQLNKIKSSEAELVFLPIYYQQASLILSQAAKIGLDTEFFGCDGLDGILTVKGFDTKLAEGVMLLTPFAADAKDKATQDFVKAYGEKFDDEPIQFTADAYDAVYIIAEAVEKAGVTPDMEASEICDKLKAVMTELKIDGVTGENIVWDASGEPSKEPKAMKIVNGAYTAM